MDILFLLVPLSVVFVFLIGVVFWWALRSGQFDDLEGPALKIILDDDTPKAVNETDRSTDDEREGEQHAGNADHDRTEIRIVQASPLDAMLERPEPFDLRQTWRDLGR
jgi:cbb3-type cytochrome oxidase maturation protein